MPFSHIPPQETTPEQPPEGPPERPLKKVASDALRLYRNVDKVDRWGGGGFTLSTLVKLAGWSGLIAVAAVLIVRMRTIEAELDSVSHGFQKLQAEVELTRKALQDTSAQSRQQLEQLSLEAATVRHGLGRAEELDQETARAVGQADRAAAALSSRLQAQGQQSQALDDQLQDLPKQAGALATQLEADGDQTRALAEKLKGLPRTAAALDALGSSLEEAQARAAALDRDVGALSPAELQDQLGALQVKLRALSTQLEQASQTLDRVSAHAAELDARLAAKLEADRRSSHAQRKAGPRNAVAPVAKPPGPGPDPDSTQ